MFKVNKNVALAFLFLTYTSPFSNVSIIDSEQVKVNWGTAE